MACLAHERVPKAWLEPCLFQGAQTHVCKRLHARSCAMITSMATQAVENERLVAGPSRQRVQGARAKTMLFCGMGLAW
eukprot:11551982-Alexandrium_andersonii.AAC.1